MSRKNFILAVILMIVVSLPGVIFGADTTPPSSPVKLVFIHHSTGGHWLADPNDYIYGGLGTALKNNNYYVSATNYCWGPDQIGSRTDIPNWPEWFTGSDRDTVMNRVYTETGQNFTDCDGNSFGSWQRLSSDPGGENQIVMFKSCFPNSNLYGNPEDPPASEPNEEYSVSNAKAVYNRILSYFATRPDKLFIVITAPPQTENECPEDPALSKAARAANARAFNNWLRNNWLSGYSLNNVAVFDYFNIMTHPDNHHRMVSGNIEHVTSPSSGNFAYYPYNAWDSHPNSEGQQKATAEFAPFLNYYYNQWKGTSSSAGTCIAVANDLALNLSVVYQNVKYGTTLDFYANPDDPGELYWKLNIAKFHNLSGDSANCIPVADDLSLSLCGTYQGKKYSFTLNYSPLPHDPAGLYWKMNRSSFTEIN